MELKTLRIEKPEGINIIIGQSHFIKTVEDLYEAIVNSVPTSKFGLSFCESSGPCLIRSEGNDDELKKLAEKNAFSLSCGHSFIIFMKNCYPINVLNAIKNVPEVCNIYCATANDVDVVIAETKDGRGILGVIDGFKSKGIEENKDKEERKKFLRNIGYKLV
ncbi:MAG: adenosine-specific kinase [Candidatus Thermoplasmatota archaeon]